MGVKESCTSILGLIPFHGIFDVQEMFCSKPLWYFLTREDLVSQKVCVLGKLMIRSMLAMMMVKEEDYRRM